MTRTKQSPVIWKPDKYVPRGATFILDRSFGQRRPSARFTQLREEQLSFHCTTRYFKACFYVAVPQSHRSPQWAPYHASQFLPTVSNAIHTAPLLNYRTHSKALRWAHRTFNVNILPRGSLSVFLYWIIESNIPPRDLSLDYEKIRKLCQEIQDCHEWVGLSWTSISSGYGFLCDAS